MTAHAWSEGRAVCTRCHLTLEELYRTGEFIECSPKADCPNGCRGGWVACWSPGGPCREPERPGCDTCGPCNHCRPEQAARWQLPDEVAHQLYVVEHDQDRQAARVAKVMRAQASACCTYCGKNAGDGVGPIVVGARGDCTRVWA